MPISWLPNGPDQVEFQQRLQQAAQDARRQQAAAGYYPIPSLPPAAWVTSNTTNYGYIFGSTPAVLQAFDPTNGCTCHQCRMIRERAQTQEPPTPAEPNMPDWMHREIERQKTRVMPIWINERFWRGNHIFQHFAHVSEKDPEMLAYTSSGSNGARDIQTPMKPGRYLTKYFEGVLNAKEIAFYASWQATGNRPESKLSGLEVLFARTPDEIADVYARGPSSCMDWRSYTRPRNPVRVYGAGDLAIAYLQSDPPPNAARTRDVVARCLVWPEKLVAGRVYPTPGRAADDGYFVAADQEDANYTLKGKLKGLGYHFPEEGARFNGARLLKLPHTDKAKAVEGCILLPYLDGGYRPRDDGEFWVMVK